MFIDSSPKAATRPYERLACDTLTSLPELEAVADEWQRLWLDCGARPFQSPAWLLPWFRHVARGRLASVALRDPATRELAGFAPFYVHEDDDGRRHLFPIGIATTDYLDVLVRPGFEAQVLPALVSHLAAQRAAWDLIEVPQLAQDAALLRCRWPAPWRRELTEGDANPVLPLGRALAPDFAKRLAYAQRRISREGRVEYGCADASQLGESVEALARLHARRWARVHQPGVLADEGVLAWHREAAPMLLAQGSLRLLALRLDGRIIAVLYCLADAARRRWYDYIGGFDPAYGKLSPGMLLVGHAIELARAEGAAHFDFLRGGEDYKYRWGAIDEPMFALRVQPASV